MGIAKRLYLYTVSSISLTVLAVGLYNLVAVALGEVADALGASVISGEGSGREQLSLAIALVVVGAPVFVIHWWLVGRGWRGIDEAARDDRHSVIRAFHMGLVATVSLAFTMYAILQLLERGFRAILGVDAGSGRMTDDIALIAIGVPVWWFHVHRRNADVRHDRLHGAAAWLTRLHRYGWAFVGLMTLLVGASRVIATLSSVAIGRSDFGDSQDWWRGPLAWSLAAIVTGAGIWWLHLDDARRSIRDASVIGEDDRSTALRTTYFGAVLLVALSSAGLTVASSITALGRQVLGVADAADVQAFLEAVIGPVLVAVPFLLAGWLHWRALWHEAARRGEAHRAAAERLRLHLAALVGIAFLTVGTARLVGLLIEQVLGSVGADDFFRGELVWCVAQVVVGAGLWFPAWTAIVRRRAVAPVTERLATTARAYLLLVLGAALIAGVPSAVIVLFRLIDTMLGGSGTALGSDLAIPLAVVAVAVVVAAYHGRLVVSDLRLASGTGPTPVVPIVEPTPAVAADSAAQSSAMPKIATGTTALALVLRADGGEDLEAIAAKLREHLPPGVVLEGG